MTTTDDIARLRELLMKNMQIPLAPGRTPIFYGTSTNTTDINEVMEAFDRAVKELEEK